MSSKSHETLDEYLQVNRLFYIVSIYFSDSLKYSPINRCIFLEYFVKIHLISSPVSTSTNFFGRSIKIEVKFGFPIIRMKQNDLMFVVF